MAGLLSKTTVVPVATGVRLEIDTSCVSCGAQAPGNADLLDTVRQRKRAPAPMPSRYQGSFDRLAPYRCRPRKLEGARQSRRLPRRRSARHQASSAVENGRGASENRGTPWSGGFTMLSRMDRGERSTQERDDRA